MIKMRSKVTTAAAAVYIADIHSHILPGIDDGSKSMEETISMLRIASAEGITHMIATPHYKMGWGSANQETIKRLLAEVMKEAKHNGLDINLYPGNEVYYNSELADRFQNGRICTINDSRYVLVEFSPMDQFTYVRNGLDDIIGMGYKPILAHVERYECLVKHPDNVRSLKAFGVGIQVNASSVIGEVGRGIKKFVHKILEEELVDYIGTDAHSANGNRKPAIKSCVSLLYKKYDSEYVADILYRNAENNFLKTNTRWGIENAGEKTGR